MIGHVEVRRLLEAGLPPVALLTGPASVGKRTLARHLCDHHEIAWYDRLEASPPLTIDTARQLAEFAARRPHGMRKAIIVALDGASAPALHALLKPLEEAPDGCHYLLTAAGTVLPTVASRAQVYRLGSLTTAELTDVLCAQGVPRPVAARAAAYGNGQAAPALAVTAGIDGAVSHVTELVTALGRHDRDAFVACFKTWTDTDTNLLLAALCEAITGRPQVFPAAETAGLRRDQATARRMLLALSQYPAARSRLGVRAALEPFI